MCLGILGQIVELDPDRKTLATVAVSGVDEAHPPESCVDPARDSSAMRRAAGSRLSSTRSHSHRISRSKKRASRCAMRSKAFARFSGSIRCAMEFAQSQFGAPRPCGERSSDRTSGDELNVKEMELV